MKLIDKDALVAVINRISFKNFFDGSLYVDTEELFTSLDTLEVAKDVDLNNVFNDEYSKFSNDIDAMDYAFPICLADYRDFAKHFFKLGLKAAQKGE